jgi:hypothetical protein
MLPPPSTERGFVSEHMLGAIVNYWKKALNGLTIPKLRLLAQITLLVIKESLYLFVRYTSVRYPPAVV